MSTNLAEQLEDNEEFDKAYEEYKRIHVQRPKSIEILERLGHLAMLLDKKDEAKEYYGKILEQDMTSILAHEQLMDIYIHTDKYKYYVSRGNLRVVQEEVSHAINDFKKALNHAQTDEEINTTRFVLATLYEQIGKNHQAIDEYLRITDTEKANEVVYLKLAKIYLAQDSISSAIEILERARNNGFDTDTVKENLAQLYLRNSQPEKAGVLTQDELVKVKSLLEAEKNQEAFEVLSKIKTKYAKNAQFHSLMAQYYFNVKNWEKSLESVNEFDKVEQNSPLTYQMRALIFEEQGKEFDAHVNWAKYNLTRKDKDVALNEYLLAYQMNDNDADLVRSIAELMEELNDKNHAAEFWEKLVAINPNDKKALAKMAEFKEHIGDYRAQVDYLENLYAIDARNTVLIKTLAKAYEKLKNKQKALEFYNKFITLSPVNDESEQIKAKISKLESTEMQEDEGLIGKIMKLFAQ